MAEHTSGRVKRVASIVVRADAAPHTHARSRWHQTRGRCENNTIRIKLKKVFLRGLSQCVSPCVGHAHLASIISSTAMFGTCAEASSRRCVVRESSSVNSSPLYRAQSAWRYGTRTLTDTRASRNLFRENAHAGLGPFAAVPHAEVIPARGLDRVEPAGSDAVDRPHASQESFP